ncbi:hypothetical protein EYF80_059392 [Liparis tanakae]|uniref:Uncharacterized protein n=1 Tax=Liparis tanakae TaxID=230148 RepID=A0A4Z2EPX6_9TELE|nr:hypothetical protein EYF80_059392 [Liparis tanakae]
MTSAMAWKSFPYFLTPEETRGVVTPRSTYLSLEGHLLHVQLTEQCVGGGGAAGHGHHVLLRQRELRWWCRCCRVWCSRRPSATLEPGGTGST